MDKKEHNFTELDATVLADVLALEAVQVYMTAFMKGEIREVRIPRRSTEDTLHDLGLVFHYGQNDNQPVAGRCSVSAGDVIFLDRKYWMVLMAGFRELSKEDFDRVVAEAPNVGHLRFWKETL